MLHFAVYDDLPPKYEDVVIGIPVGMASPANMTSTALATVPPISVQPAAPNSARPEAGISGAWSAQTVRRGSLQRQGTF